MKRGSSKRSLREKEALAKRKKFQQTYMFTEASSANLMVEGEGDVFGLNHKLQVARRRPIKPKRK
jgi:hypothetical protein